MEHVSRKKKLKPSQSGIFMQLCSRFTAGESKLGFSIPHGQIGTLTQRGGTVSLVDLTFCQRDDCRHFETRLLENADYPAPPPPRPATIRMRIPPDIPGERIVEERRILAERLPLPQDPNRFSTVNPAPSFIRQKRALDDDDEYTEEDEILEMHYTAGFRRNPTISNTSLMEDDDIELFIKRLNGHHIIKMNQAYGDLLGFPVKLEMNVSKVPTVLPNGSTRTMNQAKIKITLPPNFSVGFSEKFFLEAVGFTSRQITSFKMTHDPNTTYYGFVNQRSTEVAFTSERVFDPGNTGRYISNKSQEIKEKFKLKKGDHRRGCNIAIVSENYAPSYTKKISLNEVDLLPPPRSGDKDRALFTVTVFTSILDDVSNELQLNKLALVCTLQGATIYLRCRQPDQADIYPNLTIHFQMKSKTARHLGLTDSDIRWDGLSNLAIGYFQSMEPVDTILGDLNSPTGKKLVKKIKESPKRLRPRLFEETELAAMSQEKIQTVRQFLSDHSPLDLDRLDEEIATTTSLKEKENYLRMSTVTQEQEEAERKKKMLQRERQRIKLEKLNKQAEVRRLKEIQDKQAETERIAEEDRLLKEHEENKKKRKSAEEAAAAAAAATTETTPPTTEEERRDEVFQEAAAATATEATTEEEERRDQVFEQTDEEMPLAGGPEDDPAGLEDQAIGGPIIPAQTEEEEPEPVVVTADVDPNPPLVIIDDPVDPLPPPPAAAAAAPVVIVPPRAAAGPEEIERGGILDEDLDLDPLGVILDPMADFINVPNPAPILPPQFQCFTDNSFRGHGNFPGDDDNLIGDDYTLIFEEGVRSDYIEGIGSCCVLAYIRKDRTLDNKFLCEYPANWDGHLTLNLYNNHQAPIRPARDCLAILNVIVNHFEEK